MHPDTEKLINLAQNKGFVTRSQRESILNRAKNLGDNIVEVEFILDGIPVRDEPAVHNMPPQQQVPPQQAYQTSAPQQPIAGQKKSKTWLWISIGAAALLIIIIAIASGGHSYDSKLDKLENGYAQLFAELSGSNIYEIDDVAAEYKWLGELANELDEADANGELTPEQSYRLSQIESNAISRFMLLGLNGVMGLFSD